MMCNLFILDRKGIRLSQCTNTFLDTMPAFDKKMEELKILSDMFRLQTQVVYLMVDQDDMDENTVKKRQKRMRRIHKMQKRMDIHQHQGHLLDSDQGREEGTKEEESGTVSRKEGRDQVHSLP